MGSQPNLNATVTQPAEQCTSMRGVKVALASLALIIVAGCAPTSGTVTDPATPFADSESDALAGRGREHLVKGCVVQLLKLTERAARVKAVSCPDSPEMLPLDKWPGSTEGWVAKSALDLH
jgi:hypothetical protein